ncbi:amino acid transporter, putative [Plasmodium gallinaceum]|uniref:Amino acid transporter, putative n=1 Tax=Plasmodium gallinaceum TaxID=5849 RepID=A0A1J1GRF9_PLAGA|nr:amino acid transporter, putative [Plasmodium gallinaceum]CRG93872.1 amino acid transporter, putative [Plasmodium gallinaceum]
MNQNGLESDYQLKKESKNISDQIMNINNNFDKKNYINTANNSDKIIMKNNEKHISVNNNNHLVKNYNNNPLSANKLDEKKRDKKVKNSKKVDKYIHINEKKINTNEYIYMNDDNKNVYLHYYESNQSDYYNNENKEGINKTINEEINVEKNKNKNKNWKGRTFSRFTPGGVRSSTVLFICTAIGVGFLSIPYVFSKLGIILSLILIFFNSIESYVTTNILCLSSLEHNTFVYGNLLKKIGKSYHKTIIDIGLSFGYVSSFILILILMSDFLSSIFYVFNFPALLCNNIFIVVIVCLLILPITFRNKVGTLNYFLTFSLFSLTITVITIGIQAHSYFNILKNKNIVLFNIDRNFFKCFNVLLFSFSQQPNACFITGQFNQPTHRRINKSAYRSIMLQVIFYTLFGILGYLSFLNTAKDNIVLNYENTNISILFCKFLLSITFFFSIPLNFMGSYQSLLSLFLGIRNIFYKIYFFILRRNRYITNLSSVLRDNSVDPLEEITLDNYTDTSSLNESQTSDKKQRIFVSTVITIICALIACNVKNLSNVIGIGGGITSTLISCFLPNLIYFKNRKNVKNKFKRYITLFMLFFFSFMGFFSVIITALNLVV